MANLKDVVYLNETQYNQLVNGQTVSGHTYNENDLYLVPDNELSFVSPDGTISATKDEYNTVTIEAAATPAPELILSTAGNAEIYGSFTLTKAYTAYNMLMIQYSDNTGTTTTYKGARFYPVVVAALANMTNNTCWLNIGTSTSFGFKFMSPTNLAIEKYGSDKIYGLRIFGIK